MILKVDLGIDELDENLFRIIVFISETEKTFCHVFGETAEECEERANDLVYAYNFSTVTD